MNLFRKFAGEGQAALARGDLIEAERLFREALTHKPGSPAALRGLGVALMHQNKLSEAEAVLRQAVDVEPKTADNHHLLGSVYLANRNLVAARTHLTRALEIKPSLPGAALKIGQICYVNRDFEGAAEFYSKAYALDPLDIDALKGAVQSLLDCGRPADAAAVATSGAERLRKRGEIPRKKYAEVYMTLAHAYTALGDQARAAMSYRTLIEDDPDNNVARHLLAAVEGRLTQDHAQSFARDIFDILATTFDKRLVDQLKYRSPGVLAEGLRELEPARTRFDNVLDLGCGTGLIAHALKEKFETGKIVGVDLSPNMIKESEKRGVYTELVCADVVQAMSARHERFDLILAADVFIYVGALTQVFTLAKALLQPGGLFVFTTEIGATDVELTAQGHYRHGKAYILRLASENGFTVLRSEDAPMRKERGEDVPGHYVYLRA